MTCEFRGVALGVPVRPTFSFRFPLRPNHQHSFLNLVCMLHVARTVAQSSTKDVEVVLRHGYTLRYAR